MRHVFFFILSSLILVSCSFGAKETKQGVNSTIDSVSIVRVLPPDARIASSTVDFGSLPSGVDTILSFSIRNVDTIGVKIDSIIFSLPEAKAKFSRDTIGVQTIIAAGLKIVTPENSGDFVWEMDIYFKDIAKPSKFTLTGNIK